MRATIWNKLGLFALTLGLVVLAYAVAVRPWMLDWGSTAAERAAVLPGDSIAPAPAKSTTRAITVHAPADEVFPWLAQLGQNRAGFYSFELLEDLAGAEMPRAETLLVGGQDWQPGDMLWMYPYDKASDYGGAPLVELVPGRALAFGTWNFGTSHDLPPNGSWAFVVDPMSVDSSRLIVRGRGAAGTGFGWRLFDRAVFEPVHFVMERRMMEGIQRLAEGRKPRTRTTDLAEIFVWTAMFALFVAGFVVTLRRERWIVPFVVTLAAAAGFLVTTIFQPPAWIGLPLVAAIAWLLRRGARGESIAPVDEGSALRPAVAGRA
jgi:hypothetical protein